MKKMPQVLALSIATLMSLIACSTSPIATETTSQTNPSTAIAVVDKLRFDPTNYTQKTFDYRGKTYRYRAFENIAYVKHPVEPDYQKINIYIPESYFNQETVNGFSEKTAPIFMPNSVGGYMPAKPATVEDSGMPRPDASANKENAIMMALANGYIVAAPGARGRTLQSNGQYTGKAPAAIVDLKAAVRYLKANDSLMPGNANKIISNGTSAGGALSLLLGSSGNQPAYEADLTALGAADTTDDIWAVSAYCPIADLDHADAAYEWQFNGVNDYQKMDSSMLDYHVQRKLVKGTLTPQQISLSNQLKSLFPAYINSLHLTDSQGKLLSLDAQGDGSFKNWLVSHLIKSAQNELNQGKDLSTVPYLTIQEGKVTAFDFDLYNKTVGRQKTPPAFDGVDLSTGENQLFGTATIDKQHFTPFSQQHSTVANSSMANSNVVSIMNPMTFLTPTNTKKLPKNWRIRVGTNDRDTSLAVATLIATRLQNQGKTVDFAMPWGVPHGGDYDLDQLLAWMRQLN